MDRRVQLANLAAYYVVYHGVRGPDDLVTLIKGRHPEIPDEEVEDMQCVFEMDEFPALVREQRFRFNESALAVEGSRSFFLKAAVGDVAESVIEKLSTTVSRIVASHADVDDTLKRLTKAAQILRSVSEAAALTSIRRDVAINGVMQGVLDVKRDQLVLTGRSAESQAKLREMRRFQLVASNMRGLADEAQAAEVKLEALKKMEDGCDLERALTEAAKERYGRDVFFVDGTENV